MPAQRSGGISLKSTNWLALQRRVSFGDDESIATTHSKNPERDVRQQASD